MKNPEAYISRYVGIADSYTDQFHATIALSAESRTAVLAALGFDLKDSDKIRHDMQRIKAEEEAALPKLIVVTAERQSSHAWKGSTRSWRIELENGAVLEGKVDGRVLTLPPLPAGYHRISHGTNADSFLFSAPARCYMPPALEERKMFGISAQVYSLRHNDDLGIGDLGHVHDLVAGAGKLGIDLIGLSPLHSMFPSDRAKTSPYSPSSRFFIDPVFIDPAFAAGHVKSETAGKDRGRIVDLAQVWREKSEIFRTFWSRSKLQISADENFKAYVREQGPKLRAYATFEALSAHFARQGKSFRGDWPASLQNPETPDVNAFASEHEDEIKYWSWLQYVAEQQLKSASDTARASGMGVGLYRDLAVGADLYGSELWSNGRAWCPDLSIGAPPDPLGPKGQDWGLPPLNPIEQAASGLAEFRSLVAANMRHAGALRIDHAFQLQRLFVIPRGLPASKGAYLSYPFEAMMAVLRIESDRAKCAVIAEDLGNGPPGFSERIMECGLFSYRILSFERQRDGSFIPPAEYPKQSLACINTHDLPTFAGWWRGLDIDLRECFGIYNAKEWTSEKQGRLFERQALLKALQKEELTSTEVAAEHEARFATMRFVARTRSDFAVVSLEDVCSELNQPNIPGLADGYPNWRRRLNKELKDITAPDGDLAKCLAVVSRDRPSRKPSARIAQTVPTATYRLQLNKKFTFYAAAEIIPKLKWLGVSHLYVSPITTAKAGSTHGYDVTDPTKLNPELGGESGFNKLHEALRAVGMKLIVDIVPNHMSTSMENRWWRSVLEEGQESPFSSFFDIDWARGSGKVVLPILPKPLNEMLSEGDGRIIVADGEIAIDLGERLPVSRTDAAKIREEIRRASGPADDEAEVLDRVYNRDPEAIRALIARQAWRAIYWRTGRSEINYRRFFEIDSLAGLRVEEPEVFDAAHQLIFRLISEGKIDGLRIDHVDGLADPKAYIERLQKCVGPGAYIVVEKILGANEILVDWPVAGTTGYDALVQLDGVFLDPSKMSDVSKLYTEVTHTDMQPKRMLVELKSTLAREAFSPELTKLVDLGLHASQADLQWSDVSRDSFQDVVIAYLAHLPVYRTYMDSRKISETDLHLVTSVIESLQDVEHVEPYALSCLRTLLTDPSASQATIEFRSRLQQLSGPLMAKGQEDTLFYRYHPLVVSNEVGGDANQRLPTVDSFHSKNRERLSRYPGAMIATTTHDTKRSEDGRSRLLALAQHPDLIRQLADSWMQSASRLGFESVSRDDLYMAMQNVIASYPIDGVTQSYIDRIFAFLEKSLREGKARSSWSAPDTIYEKRIQACVAAILNDESFKTATEQSIGLLALHGAWISLCRTVMKCTSPGVPDFYQGTEGWDVSLVDPDNRRPVPFDIPARSQGGLATLMKTWKDGRVKTELTTRLLRLRAAAPEFFLNGDYQSVSTEGCGWIAYERRYRGGRILVAARRLYERAWTEPLLRRSAYEDLEQLIPFQRQENLLSEPGDGRGTATSWFEFCEGMPFAVMRSST